MFKIKNVIKSNESKQVTNIASVTGNSGTYVKMGVTTHNQYNLEVSMLKSKYLFDTENNLILFNAIDENVDLSSFETIGEEVIICGCITMHDIMDFYAHGVIQQFYDAFCKSHTNEESIVLARFLSAIGIEIWRDITCYGGIYKGKYMVSNLGRVLRLYKTRQAKILKQYEYGHGYLYVHLWHDYQRKCLRVNRLVSITFYGEPTEKLDACHSNTHNLDNRLFNLEFKTHAENIQNPITQKKLKETLKTKFDKAESKAAAAATE